MGSKLQLNSIYGKGSDFYFSLNVRKTTNKNSKIVAINSNVENNISTFDNMNSKKILIVEDNQINMLLAKTLVKKLIPNSIIISAFDGNESIDLFLKEQPDIILMDIQMPNKNGYEATIEIRQIETHSRTPIIAVTAGIFTGEKEKCFEAGMDDYLPKPIIINDLEQVITKWLNK
jgi:CheY-like chemotaxis protein